MIGLLFLAGLLAGYALGNFSGGFRHYMAGYREAVRDLKAKKKEV